jgi:hypothetical protein
LAHSLALKDPDLEACLEVGTCVHEAMNSVHDIINGLGAEEVNVDRGHNGQVLGKQADKALQARMQLLDQLCT